MKKTVLIDVETGERIETMIEGIYDITPVMRKRINDGFKKLVSKFLSNSEKKRYLINKQHNNKKND